jgi:L-rhamnose isomerase
MVTLMERLAIELIQIPLENEPLRQHQMDKMYKAWGTRKAQQMYQLPYRCDFWGKLFSKHLAARGLLHNIPQDELQEFFMNNLYNSKQMHAYVELQVEHKHTIKKTPSGWFEIYECKLDRNGENTGRMLSQFTSSQDGLRYCLWGTADFFTSVPELQTFIIQSHFETYQ